MIFFIALKCQGSVCPTSTTCQTLGINGFLLGAAMEGWSDQGITPFIRLVLKEQIWRYPWDILPIPTSFVCCYGIYEALVEDTLAKTQSAKLRWSSLKNEIQTWWDGFGYVASIELDLYRLITCYIFWEPRNSIFTKACQRGAGDGFSLSGSSSFVVPASFILFVRGESSSNVSISHSL